MNAKDLINYLIPPVKLEDTAEQVLKWMNELKLTELPVVEGNRFLGILSEEMVLSGSHHQDLVSEFPGFISESRIGRHAHYFDVLKVANQYGTKLVGVEDEENNFLGVISVQDVVEAFANSSAITTPGAILILKMEFRDYSLSEISRIVEEEQAKIISSQIVPDEENPSMIRVTVKLNTTEISQIVRILDARGYVILDQFNGSEELNPDADRFDALMKYLRI